MYLLDTDHCVFLLRNDPEVCRRFSQLSTQEAAVSILTVSELLFGAYWSAKPDANLAAVNEFLAPLLVMPLSRPIADGYGRIKAGLSKRGQRIQDPDIFIAATALEHDLILVTHNTAHYQRVPGLQLEDWYAPKPT